MATIIPIADAGDPRLGDYRDLRALPEHRLRADAGKFIAESELVVTKLIASGLDVDSVLVTEPRLRALTSGGWLDKLAPATPVWKVDQATIDAVAGFHVHRGCLAVGRRPGAVVVPAQARIVLVLEDLVDVDNLGALVRNAAAFGADALVLSPRCADPYYRKAIRVSMGNVFKVPIVRLSRWPDDLLALRAELGFTLVGAVLDPKARALPQFSARAPLALLLGSEGPGLSQTARDACDALVTIPMVGADSLNVATAGAVLLYHLANAMAPA